MSRSIGQHGGDIFRARRAALRGAQDLLPVGAMPGSRSPSLFCMIRTTTTPHRRSPSRPANGYRLAARLPGSAP